MMVMKLDYISPTCDIVVIESNYAVLDLVLSVSDEETEIVGGKEQTEFVEEEVAPTAPNLWGDDED
jgi:hypothetical protein